MMRAYAVKNKKNANPAINSPAIKKRRFRPIRD